jgi:hypothetical protein
MSKLICSNPLCKIGETGKCVDGLTAETCTKIGKATSSAADATEGNKTKAPLHEDISIAPGQRMSLQQAERLLRQRKCDVIAFIGPNESGKTSLIASMYDAFQRLPLIEGFSFVSSLTLFSFEHLLYLSRAVSGGHKPKIPHTPLRDGLGFFHLAIKSAEKDAVNNLVLIDRAGEEYKALKNNLEAGAACREILRAQLIILLVDGGKLLDVGERHSVIHDTKQTLKALLEHSLIDSSAKLAITLTKYDVISAASQPEIDRVEKDFSRLIGSLETAHPPYSPFRSFEGLFAFLFEEEAVLKTPVVRRMPVRAFSRMGF